MRVDEVLFQGTLQSLEYLSYPFYASFFKNVFAEEIIVLLT
jgi:hypothetical protein